MSTLRGYWFVSECKIQILRLYTLGTSGTPSHLRTFAPSHLYTALPEVCLIGGERHRLPSGKLTGLNTDCGKAL